MQITKRDHTCRREGAPRLRCSQPHGLEQRRVFDDSAPHGFIDAHDDMLRPVAKVRVRCRRGFPRCYSFTAKRTSRSVAPGRSSVFAAPSAAQPAAR